MTRHGFCWRAHFYTNSTHPIGYKGGGYSKFFRAWTRRGALGMAERHLHVGWTVCVRRVAD